MILPATLNGPRSAPPSRSDTSYALPSPFNDAGNGPSVEESSAVIEMETALRSRTGSGVSANETTA